MRTRMAYSPKLGYMILGEGDGRWHITIIRSLAPDPLPGYEPINEVYEDRKEALNRYEELRKKFQAEERTVGG